MSDRALGPFLKWAGGKRWFVQSCESALPNSFRDYYEPFLGGGSVFFHLAPERAVISDTNRDLIDCYRAIKTNWRLVVKHLRTFASLHTDKFYYKMRETRFRSLEKEAARFIYLNRTCFNGIYRENLNGVFNVPRGTKDSVLLPDDDFESVAKLLASANILHGDFGDVINSAGKKDFVFIDPPYTVRHNNNGFVKYNQKIFSWADQVRLRDEVKRAADRGALCLVMNANHKSIVELYEGIGSKRVLSRKSVISGNASARGIYNELAIMVGYEPAAASPVTRSILASSLPMARSAVSTS